MPTAVRDTLLLAAAGFLAGFLLYRSFVFAAAAGIDLSPLDLSPVAVNRRAVECDDLWHWPFREWGLPDDCGWRASI